MFNHTRWMTVTVTGIDEKTDIPAVVEMCAAYPSLEIGVLYSVSRAAARYPSAAWIQRFGEEHPTIKKSLHLCGLKSRDVMSLGLSEVGDVLTTYSRVQLNGFTKKEMNVKAFLKPTDVEVILQARTLEHFIDAETIVKEIVMAGNPASVLWDPSGGRGVRVDASHFPISLIPERRVKTGFAGGIRADNVQGTLDELMAAIGINDLSSPGFWIDFETGARDKDDQFSVRIATEVVSKAFARLASYHPRPGQMVL